MFLETNLAFEKMTGLTAADILNKRVSEVLPELLGDDCGPGEMVNKAAGVLGFPLVGHR